MTDADTLALLMFLRRVVPRGPDECDEIERLIEALARERAARR